MIITLCGSTRFKEEYEKVNAELTLCGYIVFSCGSFDRQYALKNDTAKKILDAVHMEKIRLSDAILVIDKDGYIGESTLREIAFAKILDKKIYYYSDTTRVLPSWLVLTHSNTAPIFRDSEGKFDIESKHEGKE